MDFVFFSGMKSIKINPSKLTQENFTDLKSQMTRLFNTIPKEVLRTITDNDQIKQAEAGEEVSKRISELIEDNENEKPIFYR